MLGISLSQNLCPPFLFQSQLSVVTLVIGCCIFLRLKLEAWPWRVTTFGKTGLWDERHKEMVHMSHSPAFVLLFVKSCKSLKTVQNTGYNSHYSRAVLLFLCYYIRMKCLSQVKDRSREPWFFITGYHYAVCVCACVRISPQMTWGNQAFHFLIPLITFDVSQSDIKHCALHRKERKNA
jgi:hypothetical protein